MNRHTQVAHPHTAHPHAVHPHAFGANRGAAMVEFVVVSPALALIGLAILQYSLLYVAKNQANHAGFMAARAGSMHNATAESISTAYLRSLAPLYGGGSNPAEVAAAVARASADMEGNYRIELINPRKASFDDFNDPALQKLLKTRSRVIPNSGLAMRDAADIKPASAQNIFDANLLKLRITHGYQPGVLAAGKVFAAALAATDDGRDMFRSRLLAAGRVPVVNDITLHMNSDAIEWADPVWISGAQGDGSSPPAPPETGDSGNGGDGKSTPPAGPDTRDQDNYPSGGTDPGCGLAACPVCTADVPTSLSFPLSADVLFDFDQAVLKPGGLEGLDDLIAEAKAAQQDGQKLASVIVSGYTDQLGGDAANQRLSEARAAAVRDYLISHGFPNVPITVRGMGTARPVVALADCAGSRDEQIDCLAPNRRVVIDIVREESKP
ncbi:MAG: TadE family protein [Burkholderia sp.]|nr:TadE family protein [Burkholderia sp.]